MMIGGRSKMKDLNEHLDFVTTFAASHFAFLMKFVSKKIPQMSSLFLPLLQ